MAANSVGSNAPDGDTLGATAADLAGCHGSAVAQAATIALPAATSATNSTPYGYSQAQADAMVVAVRALVTMAINKGFIAAT